MPLSSAFQKFKSLFVPSIVEVLTKQGDAIVQKARQNASWSTRIPDAIHLGTVKEISKGRYEIEIIIDASGDRETGAPHATAFEYGSGEQGKNGQKYIITPDKADLLAFDWQPDFVPWGSPKLFGAILESPDSTAGRYFFNLVEHPGVEARPYLEPALDAQREKFFEAVADRVVGKFIESYPKVTIIDAKK